MVPSLMSNAQPEDRQVSEGRKGVANVEHGVGIVAK
jgi:hypothetical protein